MREEDAPRLLQVYEGNRFANLRDEAIIRLYGKNRAARQSEVA
jgi:hypothetical protein